MLGFNCDFVDMVGRSVWYGVPVDGRQERADQDLDGQEAGGPEEEGGDEVAVAPAEAVCKCGVCVCMVVGGDDGGQSVSFCV